LQFEDWQYCSAALPLVSRTFALNIRALKGELQREVLLAYLWCRMLDTVEDAPSFPSARKVESLQAFASGFGPERCDEAWLRSWLDGLRDLDGQPAELDLLRQGERVARCFNQLAADSRQAIIPRVREMAEGMAAYQARPGFGRTQLLRDMEDLDRYCYYVAGTVGELLTALFLPRLRGSFDRKLLEAHSVSFGLALQVTNIAKDVMVDLERGWSYVPESLLRQVGLQPENLFAMEAQAEAARSLLRVLSAKAAGHLRDALAYTLAIPRFHRSIRLFCLWPLWMAAQTLSLMNKPGFTHQRGVSPKISRAEVRQILGYTSLRFWWNGRLTSDFSQRLQGVSLEA
jgi:farnesyl-diphosphate farnesyltransferase